MKPTKKNKQIDELKDILLDINIPKYQKLNLILVLKAINLINKELNIMISTNNTQTSNN